MFKILSINKNFKFNSVGEFISTDGSIPQNKPGTDLILIKVEGIQYWLSRSWLGLLSHYEVKLSYKDCLKIKFVECKSKVIGLKCGHLMTFKSPIYIGDEFYIIPGFTNFAIRKSGEVKSLKSGIILSQCIGPYGYPYVNIRDADKNKWRSVSTHILLARTFVQNDDITTKFFINHKDGNKLNYKLSNLEWVTSRENQNHAIENGLRKDNKACKVRDSITGEIKEYPSIGLALQGIGLKVARGKLTRRVQGQIVPRLLNKRFEIKMISDQSEWFYKDNSALIDIVKRKGPYQALNLTNGEVIETPTISELSTLTNISKNRIENAINYISNVSVDNFIFRSKSNDCWPTEYSEINFSPKRSFELTNNITKEKIVFNSLRQTTSFLDIDKRTLKNRLKRNKPYGEWKIKELCNNSPISQ